MYEYSHLDVLDRRIRHIISVCTRLRIILILITRMCITIRTRIIMCRSIRMCLRIIHRSIVVGIQCVFFVSAILLFCV